MGYIHQFCKYPTYTHLKCKCHYKSKYICKLLIVDRSLCPYGLISLTGLEGIQFARPYLMAVQIMNLSYMTIQDKINFFIPNGIVVIIRPNLLLFKVSSRPASTPLQKLKMLNIKTYVLLNNVDNSWQPWILGKWIKVKESHAGLSFSWVICIYAIGASRNFPQVVNCLIIVGT